MALVEAGLTSIVPEPFPWSTSATYTDAGQRWAKNKGLGNLPSALAGDIGYLLALGGKPDAAEIKAQLPQPATKEAEEDTFAKVVKEEKGKRKRDYGKARKTKVDVRLTDEERASLTEVAKSRGASVSAYLREGALQHLAYDRALAADKKRELGRRGRLLG